MKRTALILLIIGQGVLCAWAQTTGSVTGAATAQPADGASQVPPATAVTAPQTPASSPFSINLGTGELLGATGTPLNSARLAGQVRPPSNLAVAPRPSSITPVQMQNINRLDVELNGLGLPGRNVAEQQRTLTELLQTAPITPEHASAESISQLAATLARVVPSLNLTAAQRRQLAIDLNLALNSGRLAPAEAERVMADARSLLQPGTVKNAQGVEQLMGNLSALIASQQAKAGTQSQTGQVTVSPAPASPAPTQTGQSGGSQTGQASGSSSAPPVQPER